MPQPYGAPAGSGIWVKGPGYGTAAADPVGSSRLTSLWRLIIYHGDTITELKIIVRVKDIVRQIQINKSFAPSPVGTVET